MNNDNVKAQLAFAIHSLAESVKDWDDETLENLRLGISFNKTCIIRDWEKMLEGDLPNPNPCHDLMRMELRLRW